MTKDLKKTNEKRKRWKKEKREKKKKKETNKRGKSEKETNNHLVGIYTMNIHVQFIISYLFTIVLFMLGWPLK